MDLCLLLGTARKDCKEKVVGCWVLEVVTMVPYVMRPMRAVGGRRLKLTIRVSFKACKSETSRQVSTTYRKMGPCAALLLRMYSMVVN
jgi:hypothetical protein